MAVDWNGSLLSDRVTRVFSNYNEVFQRSRHDSEFVERGIHLILCWQGYDLRVTV